jgi:hypothetical protein
MSDGRTAAASNTFILLPNRLPRICLQSPRAKERLLRSFRLLPDAGGGLGTVAIQLRIIIGDHRLSFPPSSQDVRRALQEI